MSNNVMVTLSYQSQRVVSNTNFSFTVGSSHTIVFTFYMQFYFFFYFCQFIGVGKICLLFTPLLHDISPATTTRFAPGDSKYGSEIRRYSSSYQRFISGHRDNSECANW